MKKEIIVFNPTPNEFASCRMCLEMVDFKNFSVRTVLSGVGKVNAAWKMTEVLGPLMSQGRAPVLILGAGTSGSLNAGLKSGDLIISAEAVISDWRLVGDDEEERLCRYADLEYRPVDDRLVEEMVISSRSPMVRKLIDTLDGQGFIPGRLLTSDAFLAGLRRKLDSGRIFKALACDMESGVFGYLAEKKFGGLPWFNLRVVADTLNHTFTDYQAMERDMTEILGQGLVKVLQAYDALML